MYIAGFLLLSITYWIYITFPIYNIILWGLSIVIIITCILAISNEFYIMELNKEYAKEYNILTERLKSKRLKNESRNKK
jgi:hypothetical protein